MSQKSLLNQELGSTDPSEKKIVIIGAGYGGLSAAIRLLARGYRVVVLERQSQPGGRGSVHKLDGFSFDAGPTVVTIPPVFEDLFSEADRKFSDYVKLLSVYPYYRVYFHDQTYFDYGEPEKNIAQMEKMAPNDIKGYRKLLRDIKPIYEKGFEELAFKPFTRLWDMIKIIPSLLKLKGVRSNYGLIKSRIKNDKLRQVFSFHPLLIGGNPFKVPAIYSMIQHLEKEYGIWYPVGGTHAIVKSMVKVIEELGGQVITDATVDEIEIEKRQVTGVRLDDGRVFEADIVVSNADVRNTYVKLIDKKHRRWNKDFRYKIAKQSMGLVVIYFGTKRKYEDIPHHSIILGPRYKGLLNDIFLKKKLTKDFSSYLHRSTATDPSLAPEGHEAFYILIPVPNLDADVDWEEEKERFKNKVYEFLEENYLPDLRENIVVDKITTPLDFENNLLAYKGSGFSLEPRLTQSAYFRPHNKSEDIKGLYIVGAGTHPGAGLPGVVASSKITADLIDKDYR